MKTVSYNPSELEVKFAEAIVELKSELENKISGCKILDIENKINADNPILLLHLEDKDGDKHDMVFKIIQRPDKLS